LKKLSAFVFVLRYAGFGDAFNKVLSDALRVFEQALCTQIFIFRDNVGWSLVWVFGKVLPVVCGLRHG
jgi:hypothetical protein